MGMDWTKSPFERRSIQWSMKVRDSDGKVLGKVAWIGQTLLVVRRRRSSQLWMVPLSRVERLKGRSVYVAGHGDAALEPADGERLSREIPTSVHPLAEASRSELESSQHV
jgi:hypothetical protein